MRVEVNGMTQDIAAASLAEAVTALGLADAVVATALNGDFVPCGARAATRLSEGDRIEIIAPMQGG